MKANKMFHLNVLTKHLNHTTGSLGPSISPKTKERSYKWTNLAPRIPISIEKSTIQDNLTSKPQFLSDIIQPHRSYNKGPNI